MVWCLLDWHAETTHYSFTWEPCSSKWCSRLVIISDLFNNNVWAEKHLYFRKYHIIGWKFVFSAGWWNFSLPVNRQTRVVAMPCLYPAVLQSADLSHTVALLIIFSIVSFVVLNCLWEMFPKWRGLYCVYMWFGIIMNLGVVHHFSYLQLLLLA